MLEEHGIMCWPRAGRPRYWGSHGHHEANGDVPGRPTGKECGIHLASTRSPRFALFSALALIIVEYDQLTAGTKPNRPSRICLSLLHTVRRWRTTLICAILGRNHAHSHKKTLHTATSCQSASSRGASSPSLSPPFISKSLARPSPHIPSFIRRYTGLRLRLQTLHGP